MAVFVGAVEVVSDFAVLVTVLLAVIVVDAVEVTVPVLVVVTVVGTVVVVVEVLVVVFGTVVTVVESTVAVVVTGTVPVTLVPVTWVVVAGIVVVAVNVWVEVVEKVAVTVAVAMLVLVGPAIAGPKFAALKKMTGAEAAPTARTSTTNIAIDPITDLFLRAICRNADLKLTEENRDPKLMNRELTRAPITIRAARTIGTGEPAPEELTVATLSLLCPTGDQ